MIEKFVIEKLWWDYMKGELLRGRFDENYANYLAEEWGFKLLHEIS